MSSRKFTYRKFSIPTRSKTALVQSINRSERSRDEVHLVGIAPSSHTSAHPWHLMHFSWSTFHSLMASTGHILTHSPHFVQRPRSMTGGSYICTSYLEVLVVQPTPMFLSAPPKPLFKCPLKCASEITLSASAMCFATYTLLS